MKKMFYSFLVLFTIALVFNLNAQNTKTTTAVSKWKYEVAQAPYGYNTGVLEIKQLKDTLTGKVSFSSGQDVNLQKLTMRNDTIWANVYVDGENIAVVAKIDKLKMNGSVNTSMGVMSLKADKVVETKK